MNNLFTRSKLNPILRPNPANWWETKKLYNPGIIFYDNKYHMFYRAVGSDENWKSSIGYASSDDGENFQKFNDPLLSGETEFEKRGLEDPRITKIDDIFYMSYAAYDGITPRLSIATSLDLKNWQKQDFAFSDWQFAQAGGIFTSFDDDNKPFVKPQSAEWSKSGAIFPEKINGKFLMLFGEHRIWFATSDDGIKWVGDQTPFLGPRSENYFDNTFVETGPPPIKTEKGWLVLYHGIDEKNCYRIGFLLLDLDDPRKILWRSDEPIFEPKENYETSGMVDVMPGGTDKMEKMSDFELNNFIAEKNSKGAMPKIVFCCGAVVVNGTLRIYYGASDSVICTATANLNEILKLAEKI